MATRRKAVKVEEPQVVVHPETGVGPLVREFHKKINKFTSDNLLPEEIVANVLKDLQKQQEKMVLELMGFDTSWGRLEYKKEKGPFNPNISKEVNDVFDKWFKEVKEDLLEKKGSEMERIFKETVMDLLNDWSIRNYIKDKIDRTIKNKIDELVKTECEEIEKIVEREYKNFKEDGN